jgi:hypothetical protein
VAAHSCLRRIPTRRLTACCSSCSMLATPTSCASDALTQPTLALSHTFLLQRTLRVSPQHSPFGGGCVSLGSQRSRAL